MTRWRTSVSMSLACRILAIDGLPEAYGALDRIEALTLDESRAMLVRQVQRIEQGMGRGVRSNDDHCVVMLLGSRLTQRIHTARGMALFSPATRAQLELSEQVADLLHNRPFTDLAAVVDQCLSRDRGWVTASRDALDGVTYDLADRVTPHAIALRSAFDLAERGRHREAAKVVQAAADKASDARLRGWLKQRAAAYLHPADPVAAQAMQVSAQGDQGTAQAACRCGVRAHQGHGHPSPARCGDARLTLHQWHRTGPRVRSGAR